MKRFKKIIAVALAAALSLSMTSMPAFAAAEGSGAKTDSVLKKKSVEKEFDGSFDVNCNVEEIELPASLTSVNTTRYPAFSYERAILNIKKVTIRTRQLDGRSLAALVFDWNIDPKILMEQLPDQISYKDGKYVSKDV